MYVENIRNVKFKHLYFQNSCLEKKNEKFEKFLRNFVRTY